MTGYKIRMEVGFQDVLDGIAGLGSAVNVRLYFAQGIYNQGLAFRGDVVGPLGQTTGINLFNGHGNALLFDSFGKGTGHQKPPP
jgi:hypothetical protein